MDFIQNPNLPEGPVKLVLVDGRVNEEIERKLMELGMEVIKTGKHSGTYDAVSYHPDIMLHHLGENKIVFAPGTNAGLLSELSNRGFHLIKGRSGLSYGYPGNIAYNVARIGKFAFHNLKYTDSVLKEQLDKAGVEPVHVNQGYAKCSICVVNESSLMTSDKGIAKAAAAKCIDVLVLDEDEGIVLPGLKNGFIGGSTGLVDNKLLAVAGNAKLLKSYWKIVEFLSSKGIEIISLAEGNIIDVGSIIPLMK